MILHITLPEDWAAARRTGRYTASTRGASIDDVGFLHASDDAAQVGMVGAAIYPDRPDAFVVGLDEDELAGAGLRVRREPGVRSMWRIFESSSLSMTGKGRNTCRAEAGVARSRFCSGPITRLIDVTISSRIASSGGFVTWANSSTK